MGLESKQEGHWPEAYYIRREIRRLSRGTGHIRESLWRQHLLQLGRLFSGQRLPHLRRRESLAIYECNDDDDDDDDDDDL